MLPSSVEEGKLWPKAMAGVVRPARVPTTPRWLPPRKNFSSLHPLLTQGGELFLVLMSPCIGTLFSSAGRVRLPLMRRATTRFSATLSRNGTISLAERRLGMNQGRRTGLNSRDADLLNRIEELR